MFFFSFWPLVHDLKTRIRCSLTFSNATKSGTGKSISGQHDRPIINCFFHIQAQDTNQHANSILEMHCAQYQPPMGLLLKIFEFKSRMNDATAKMVNGGHFTLANLRYGLSLIPFYPPTKLNERKKRQDVDAFIRFWIALKPSVGLLKPELFLLLFKECKSKLVINDYRDLLIQSRT